MSTERPRRSRWPELQQYFAVHILRFRSLAANFRASRPVDGRKTPVAARSFIMSITVVGLHYFNTSMNRWNVLLVIIHVIYAEDQNPVRTWLLRLEMSTAASRALIWQIETLLLCRLSKKSVKIVTKITKRKYKMHQHRFMHQHQFIHTNL